MSVAPEKMAGLLALPIQDRAFIARQLIASLDAIADEDSESQWQQVINQRSREVEEGKAAGRPPAEAVREIRGKLNAIRNPS